MPRQFDTVVRYLSIISTIITFVALFGCVVWLSARTRKKKLTKMRIAGYALILTLPVSWIPVNMWLERHDSALLSAVINGDVSAARKAFNEGGNVKMEIRRHFTLLQIAARQGSVDMARLLVEHGADVTASNDDGDTAFKIALANKHPDMANYLQSLIESNHTNRSP